MFITNTSEGQSSRSVLRQNFDFGRILENREYYSTYGGNVFDDLSQVRPDWKFETLGPLKHTKKGRMQVVIRMSTLHPRAIIRRLFRLSRDAF